VVSTDPPIVGCGGQGVLTNQQITATFSEPMDSASILAAGTFAVTLPDTTPVAGTVTYDATNNIAIFAPTGGVFATNTTFTATITTAAQSMGSLPLASSYAWSFTTGSSADSTSPSVTSTNPADTASGVATNQKIAATFNEGMDSTTLSSSTFTVTDPELLPVVGTVSYDTSGTTATFTPTSALAPGTVYTASITTGVRDLGGNALAPAVSWSFTTGSGVDSVPPTVSATVPANAAGSVSLTSGINATFSKAMDPATINAATFQLAGPGPTAVTGKVTYNAATDTATFTPVDPLGAGASYTATITAKARDLEGNALAADSQWTFGTGTASGLLPIDLGAATNFAVFAQASVTNTAGPGTIVTGDLGVSPGGTVTGFLAANVNGTIQTNNSPAAGALTSLATAYTTAKGLSGAITIPENLAGQTLVPGLYKSAASSLEITSGNLMLDAQGDPNSVWVFQMPASTLTLTTPSCNVVLQNGAQASNIFWQVGSSATIGVSCVLQGSILADTSITVAAGATVKGRVLAGAITGTGALTTDSNHVSLPGCK
jgi:hypothetical protein